MLTKDLPDIKLNGHPEQRLPNTLNISFPKVEANTLLAELEGVAASAGAACHADNVDLSPVLTAMNIPMDYAMGTIRFSTGRYTTNSEITKAAKSIVETVKNYNPNQHLRLNPWKQPAKLNSPNIHTGWVVHAKSGLNTSSRF